MLVATAGSYIYVITRLFPVTSLLFSLSLICLELDLQRVTSFTACHVIKIHSNHTVYISLATVLKNKISSVCVHLLFYWTTCQTRQRLHTLAHSHTHTCTSTLTYTHTHTLAHSHTHSLAQTLTLTHMHVMLQDLGGGQICNSSLSWCCLSGWAHHAWVTGYDGLARHDPSQPSDGEEEVGHPGCFCFLHRWGVLPLVQF